jgi:hypothetical protein
MRSQASDRGDLLADAPRRSQLLDLAMGLSAAQPAGHFIRLPALFVVEDAYANAA